MMVQGGSSKKSEEHMNNLHRPQLFFFADIWDIPENESTRE